MKIARRRTFNQVVDSLRIEIADSGIALLGTDWQYTDMCSPYSRLYYISGGEGLATYDGTTIRLVPGFVYFIPAGLTFSYACNSFMHQLYFHINVFLPNGRDLFLGHAHCLALPVAPEICQRLFTQYEGERLLDGFSALNQVRTDIARIMAETGLGDMVPDALSPFLSDVYTAVRHALSSRLTIRSVAQSLHLAESTLAKRFRAETGITLGRYIDDLVLQEACRQLASTDRTIGTISDALLFCDQFYFSRYFKQRLGETPSQYRRKHAYQI